MYSSMHVEWNFKIAITNWAQWESTRELALLMEHEASLKAKSWSFPRD
jgi:hypothetical protein